MSLFSLIAKGYYKWRLVKNVILRYCSKGLFAECGSNVTFYPLDSTFFYSHIHIGSDVQIGDRAYFLASVSHIYIGNKVRIAPSVTIRGGNHITDVVGRYMFDFNDNDKRPGDDEDVRIEDDVWIGTNVTILKGVTIGRGSVVAAGAVVNRSCAPYSIIGGVPAKVLKMRFSPDQIQEHERILYNYELVENNSNTNS